VAADTALVSYWLGSESAYAWVVSSGEIHWVRLASARTIADEAANFHRSLTRLVDVPVERRLREGFTLYTMIVHPLEPWLSGVRNWVIVPDGALDYVAFAALRIRDDDPESFVVMQHDVAVTPAAWMLHVSHDRRPERTEGRVLLVADPVYQADDPRLAPLRTASAGAQIGAYSAPGPADLRYSRLRFSGEEAAGIAAQFQQGEVEELTGVDATRERLLALDWSQYRFIHIATHGIVDAQVPELSSLILGSYDSHGQVSDRAVRVADLSLQTLRAEVAVLSACETALGAEVRSEGLVGLSSTLLARGAHAVVASLWPVPDEVSARLMTEFYQHMLQGSMGPQAALGAAMRSSASREASADPALWGAFQVSITAVGPRASNAGTAKVATANLPAE
jgi:CHAT domain-containing protein